MKTHSVREQLLEHALVLIRRRGFNSFSDSDGQIRLDIINNPWQQVTDWRRAISYLQQRPEGDENRIGL